MMKSRRVATHEATTFIFGWFILLEHAACCRAKVGEKDRKGKREQAHVIYKMEWSSEQDMLKTYNGSGRT